MRVAIVYDAVYPYVKGGVERRVYDLARSLSEKHEVCVFGMKYWKGPRLRTHNGVNYYGVCRPLKLYTASGRRGLIEPLYFSISLLPALLQFDFDLIDCQNFPYLPCFSAKICSVIRKKPLIITWCEAWGDYWYKYLGTLGWFGRQAEKLTLRLTENHLSLSALTAENLLSLGKKSKAIEPGMDFDSIKRFKHSKKRYDVAFVGRLIREKNADVLVRAIGLTKANAVIIGGGPEEERINQIVQEFGLQDRIKLTGFLKRDEYLEYIASSRIFVSLSEREGFGIAANEALALGLQVITIPSRVNALSSRVDKSHLCSLSEEDVAEKIDLLLSKKAGTSQKKALKQNSIGESAALVERYYQQVAGSTK